MSEENLDDLFENEVEDEAGGSGSKIDIEISDAVEADFCDQQDLLDQVKDAEGRALRAQAELENFRARTRREMDDQLRFANQGLLNDLLPAIDNIFRAVSAASKDEEAGGVLEGVLMVAQQLIDTLERYHCKRIDAVGAEFDPNLHEAISQMPSDQHEAGTVIQAVQEGYVLHERVIRPAQVIVSTGPADPTE